MKDRTQRIVEKLMELSNDNMDGVFITEIALYKIVNTYFKENPTEQYTMYFEHLLHDNESNGQGFLIKSTDFLLAINSVEFDIIREESYR